MKFKPALCTLLSALALTLALPLLTGCNTLGKMGKLAGYAGTSAALKQHPEWRPYFVQADADLALIEASESIDTVDLLAIMNRLPIDKLNSDEAVIIITTTVITIEEFGGESVSLDEVQKADLKKFVSRLRQGIRLALNQTPAPSTFQPVN